MKMIELKEALKELPVSELVKNIVGTDTSDNPSLITADRLAAVLGEFYGKPDFRKRALQLESEYDFDTFTNPGRFFSINVKSLNSPIDTSNIVCDFSVEVELVYWTHIVQKLYIPKPHSLYIRYQWTTSGAWGKWSKIN